MRSGFILSCESTIDLPYSYCEQRDIPVLFYSYQVDGVSYEDDMGRDPEALPQFYGFLDAGKLPSTAQLNEFQYETFFDALLQQGDVLHIAFGSGMTASVQNAMLAAETLREKYPKRKLTVIDSLCSSSGCCSADQVIAFTPLIMESRKFTTPRISGHLATPVRFLSGSTFVTRPSGPRTTMERLSGPCIMMPSIRA